MRTQRNHVIVDEYERERADREARMRLHIQLQHEHAAFLRAELLHRNASTISATTASSNSQRPTQSERLSGYSGTAPPTTSTSTAMQRQHGRPHIVQPDSSDHLITLTEFLRETNELRARRDQAERHLQDLLRTRRENRAHLLALVDETYQEERNAATTTTTTTTTTLTNRITPSRNISIQSPNDSLTQPTTTSSTSTVVARARRSATTYRPSVERLLPPLPSSSRRDNRSQFRAEGHSDLTHDRGELGNFDALVRQIRRIGDLQDEILTESIHDRNPILTLNDSTDSSLEIVRERDNEMERNVLLPDPRP